MSHCQLDHGRTEQYWTHIRILGQFPGHERDGVGRLLQPHLVPAVLHHRHLLQPITAQYWQLSANHSSVLPDRPITAKYSELSTNQRGVLPSHLDQQLVGHVVEEAVRGEENHVPVLHAELVLVRGLGPGHNQSEVSIMSSNDQSEVSIESLPVGQDFALKLSGRKRELEGSVEVVLLLVRSKHVWHVNPVSNLES